jgi:hypothetical protein
VVTRTRTAAHDDIVHIGGVEFIPLPKSLENLGEDALRVYLMEATSRLALSPWGPHGIDDQGFRVHVHSPW